MKRILALLLMMTVLTCAMALAEAPDDGVTDDMTQTEGAIPEDGADDDTETEGGEEEAPPAETEPEYIWFLDDTVCVFGPKIPGNWQTCAVADLSVDGVQSFDLVGSGCWDLGTVYVTVRGDEVTVDYCMTEDINARDIWDDVNVDAEYLNIFADVESVDCKAEGGYTFGEPISISADLGGDTVVAVYVRLTADFPAGSPFVPRFWPNHPDNAAIVAAMNALLAE